MKKISDVLLRKIPIECHECGKPMHLIFRSLAVSNINQLYDVKLGERGFEGEAQLLASEPVFTVGGFASEWTAGGIALYCQGCWTSVKIQLKIQARIRKIKRAAVRFAKGVIMSWKR